MDLSSFTHALASLGYAFLAALLGRIVKHIHLVNQGLRRFWCVQLLLELPVAIFMGFVGSGLAEWLELSQNATIGLVAAISYVGPTIIEKLVLKRLSSSEQS